MQRDVLLSSKEIEVEVLGIRRLDQRRRKEHVSVARLFGHQDLESIADLWDTISNITDVPAGSI